MILVAIFLFSSCFKKNEQKTGDAHKHVGCEKNSWSNIVSSKKRVTIYTIEGCPYCIRAIQLLQQQGITYEKIDVTANPAQRAWLQEKTGQKTVPQIFFENRTLGGHSDLVALLQSPQRSVLLCSRQKALSKNTGE